MKLLSIRPNTHKPYIRSTRHHQNIATTLNTDNFVNIGNKPTKSLNNDKEEKSNVGIIIASVISVLGGGIIIFFLVIKIVKIFWIISNISSIM